LRQVVVNATLALNGLGRTEEAVAILQRLVESPGELLNTHAVAYLALAAIRAQPRG